MKPILAICPTRQRVEKCKRMMDSFTETQDGNIDLVFVVDNNDPDLDEYIKLFGQQYPYYILDQMTITEIFNKVALELEPNYNIYHTANDDFSYQTKGFDRLIINSYVTHGEGVYYGDDGHWHEGLAVGPFITSGLVHALGYLQMPKLIHLCNDTVWTLLGNKGNFLHYIPEILIEHIHPETRNIPRDITSRRVNSRHTYNWDYYQFFLWKRDKMEGELVKCLGSAKEKK